MTDLRELRPYLDVLVDHALAHVDADLTGLVEPSRRRRRWPIAIAAALVAAAIVVAVLVIRSTTTTHRSVQVPAQQIPAGDPDPVAQCIEEHERQPPPPGPVTAWGVVDLGGGGFVPMTYEDYCVGTVRALESMPFTADVLQHVGVDPQVVYRSGTFDIRYVERIEYQDPHKGTGGSTNIEVSADEVAQRVAAIQGSTSSVVAEATGPGASWQLLATGNASAVCLEFVVRDSNTKYCGTLSTPASLVASTTQDPSGQMWISGVAPTASSSVVVTLADGTTLPIDPFTSPKFRQSFFAAAIPANSNVARVSALAVDGTTLREIDSSQIFTPRFP
jgi:hypothetical protein